MTAKVHLRPGFVQPVWMGHPWVFAQAVARTEGSPEAGDEVTVFDPQGKVLGRGYWSPASAIPVRMLTRDGEQRLDEDFLRTRIDEAIRWRRTHASLPSPHDTGYRLINAEGDNLSGLVVDVFGTSASVQWGTIGMKRREREVFDALRDLAGITRIYEIASGEHQQREGFTVVDAQVRGESASSLMFTEGALRFDVPAPGSAGGGQKTGYYFDQRENRAHTASFAAGARVLDAYAYVGGFGLAAARAGASEVLCVESATHAVETGRRIADTNDLASRVRFERGDAREVMTALADRGERFDVVVLDPPKLARAAREVERATGHYRRLNALGARLVARGGVLVTCSCSGSVTHDVFLRAVSAGLRDAGRDAILLSLRGAAVDHLTPIAFNEGRYLKCATLRVT